MSSTSLSAVGREPTAEPSIIGPRDRSGDAAPPVDASTHDLDDHPWAPPHTAQNPAPVRRAGDGDGATMVLPYVGSPISPHIRPLRAWMLTAPIDLVALLTPLLVTDRYWRGTLFTAGLTIVIFAVGGLYHARRHVSILDELPSLGGRLLASAAIVAVIAALRHGSIDYGAGFMRGVALSAGLVVIGRVITRNAVIIARKRRWVEHNAVIIGSGPIAAELARLLRRYPQYGLRYVGCVDTDFGNGARRIPLIGTLDTIEETIAMVEGEVLIVADTECPDSTLMDILRRPAFASCDLWVVPRLWGSRAVGRASDHIGAVPIVQRRHTSLSGPRWAIKRAFDITFAAVSLVALSPVLLLCAVATRLEGGPGIFFQQERVGRYGKPFNLVKFRSMRPVNEDESRTNWSIADDQRVGPVGRIMRRTSLDELPQLWNILRGDMTIVGPRPERPFFVEKFSAEHPHYAMRHRVPVGLTGLAQVSGLRGDTPISDRARFDNYYIENWSLWLDVKVILRTVGEVLRGGGR